VKNHLPAFILVVFSILIGCSSTAVGNNKNTPVAPPLDTVQKVVVADQGKQDAAATVGSRKITSAELDEAAKQDLLPLATQIYQIKKARLDSMIEDLLYQEEAKAQKKSVEELRQAGSPANISVSDDAIEVFYDSNRAHYGSKKLEEVKDEIRQFLTVQKQEKARLQKMDELKKKYAVQIYLNEPKVNVETAGHPSRGPENAKVTIVEFSDFQCPFCKRFTQTIDQIVKEYPKDVRHVYRNLPLSFHNQARGAAKAAVCADRQGKFWQYRDTLFQNNTAMDDTNLKKYAGDVGLDLAKYDECLKDPSTEKSLDDDLAYAGKVGARGTPTSFVNGVLFSGARPYEELKKVVEDKIKGN